MRSTPIEPAAIAFDGDAPPRSTRHDDLYHPASGALAQARHVFLAGNGLPERWRRRDRFVVLETGFGLGHNALATWQAWRDDPDRPRRLEYIAIDRHPPTRAQLCRAPREPALAATLEALATAWPPLVHGLHRLAFDEGGFELLLAFGDVADWLPQLVARVDAFFLDGFAPARNADMWEPRSFKAMARLAAPGATAATWSAARSVREALGAAGFVVRRAAGQGGKRDITLAEWQPRPTMRTATDTRVGAARPATPAPRIAVVGAGLAGSAVVDALARHGLACSLFDAAPAPAAGASGNPAGLFHAVVHGDDGRHARWHRAAALAVAREVALARQAIDDPARFGAADGLLRLVPGAGIDALRALAAALALPPDHARAVDVAEASSLAGTRVASPGWWLAAGGWVDPVALVRHRLDRAGAACERRLGVRVAGLRASTDDGSRWALVGDAGRRLGSFDVVVLANAGDAARLVKDLQPRFDGPGAGLQLVRGQLSGISRTAASGGWPRVPVAGAGYAIPVGDTLWFGATADRGDAAIDVRACDHARNVEWLKALLPALDLGELPPIEARSGRAGVRVATADRLPIAGPVADRTLPSQRPESPRHAPRLGGLHAATALGSRGIASSRLAGDVVAALIAGAPVPVEADLLDAVDPARFAARRAASGGADARQAGRAGADEA